jgi:hypothetical protein
MSRYIDADALLSKGQFVVRMNDYGEYFVTVEEINKMPTVDAVPVVRCRECKWAEVDAWWTYCKLGHKEDTTNSIIYTCTHDFYCADGERKSDEQQPQGQGV